MSTRQLHSLGTDAHENLHPRVHCNDRKRQRGRVDDESPDKESSDKENQALERQLKLVGGPPGLAGGAHGLLHRSLLALLRGVLR